MSGRQERIGHPFRCFLIEARLRRQPGGHPLGLLFGEQPLDDLDLPQHGKAAPRLAEQCLVRQLRRGLVALQLAVLVAFEIEPRLQRQFSRLRILSNDTLLFCRSASATLSPSSLLTDNGLRPAPSTAKLRTSCQMRKRWASGCAHGQRKPSTSLLSCAGSSEHFPVGGCVNGR